MLLSTIRSHGRRIENLFGKLNVDLHQFQKHCIPPPLQSRHLNLDESKIILGPGPVRTDSF